MAKVKSLIRKYWTLWLLTTYCLLLFVIPETSARAVTAKSDAPKRKSQVIMIETGDRRKTNPPMTTSVDYYNRSRTYCSKGEYGQAIADCTKAIEINPRYVEAYCLRGAIYCVTKGQYDRAILDYTKAIEIAPRSSMAYSNRGIAYKAKGQLDRAISDYNKAIEINPRFTEAYINRGIIYLSKGRYNQAITDCTKAIKIGPEYALAYLNRGIAYAHKGEYDRAISDLTKAIKVNPRYAKVFYSRGIIYYIKGEYDKAWEDVHKAQSLGLQANPKFLKLLREVSQAPTGKSGSPLIITKEGPEKEVPN